MTKVKNRRRSEALQGCQIMKNRRLRMFVNNQYATGGIPADASLDCISSPLAGSPRITPSCKLSIS